MLFGSCFLAHVAIIYCMCLQHDAEHHMYAKEQKVLQEGLTWHFYTTQLCLSPNTTFHIIVKQILDETHCSVACVLCSSLIDFSALRNISGNELLNRSLADSSHSSKQSFSEHARGFFCILCVFLFARLISFSLPEN